MFFLDCMQLSLSPAKVGSLAGIKEEKRKRE